jgi:hypothetical protein
MIGDTMSAHNLIKSYLRRSTQDSLLGVGCYSAVILANNSRDQVVKIGSQIDDPWLDYYYEVVKGMQSPHTPKVSRLYVDKQSDYYIAMMEQLHKLDHKNNTFVELVRRYTVDEVSYDEVAAAADALDSIPSAEHFMAFLDYILVRTDVTKRSWDGHKTCNDDDRTLDIHQGNWMLRRDGTLVLIDPWAEFEIEADLERWAEDNLYSKYGFAL